MQVDMWGYGAPVAWDWLTTSPRVSRCVIPRRNVALMTTEAHPTPPSDKPDGSTDISDERAEYTEELSDGSSTDAAPEKSAKDSDTASGGEPDNA